MIFSLLCGWECRRELECDFFCDSDDYDIGAVECGWLIQCDCWCDTDDNVDDDGESTIFSNHIILSICCMCIIDEIMMLW